jgi:predicted RNA-binding Zn-ribbon protein involved in translation (DUF1610 family)
MKCSLASQGWRFRCPYCGNEKTNALGAKGYQCDCPGENRWLTNCRPKVLIIAGVPRHFCVLETICYTCKSTIWDREAIEVRCPECKERFAFSPQANRPKLCTKRKLEDSIKIGTEETRRKR